VQTARAIEPFASDRESGSTATLLDVEPDAPLSTSVLFEIPAETPLEDLSRRLRQRRLETLHRPDGALHVMAHLRSDEGDLAVLLRGIEEWVEEHELSGVRFHIDGRSFPLPPTPSDLAASA
jgi:hypothetical protein